MTIVPHTTIGTCDTVTGPRIIVTVTARGTQAVVRVGDAALTPAQARRLAELLASDADLVEYRETTAEM